MAKIYGFVGKFGKQGVGDGQFSSFKGIASDSTRLYVLDSSRIQIFDINSPWSLVKTIALPGEGFSIVVDNTHIYVSRTSTVYQYNKTSYVMTSVNIANTTNMTLADDGLNIVAFRYDYPSTYDWYYIEKASFTTAVSRGAWAYSTYGYPRQSAIVNGVMYTVNSGSIGLVRYPDYPLLTNTSFIGGGSTFKGVALDTNCIYVTNEHTVRSYDISSFAYKDYFGALGTASGYFNTPLYTTYQNGKLFICDQLNYRIQIINWSDIAGLNAPTNLSLACLSGGKIQVSWTDNS